MFLLLQSNVILKRKNAHIHNVKEDEANYEKKRKRWVYLQAANRACSISKRNQISVHVVEERKRRERKRDDGYEIRDRIATTTTNSNCILFTLSRQLEPTTLINLYIFKPSQFIDCGFLCVCCSVQRPLKNLILLIFTEKSIK